MSKFAYIPAKQFTSISKIQNSNLKKTSFENLSIVCMSIQESGIHAALPTCTQRRRRRRRSLSTRSSLCRTGNKHMGPKEEKESGNRSSSKAATKFFLMLISNKTTTSIATYKNSSTPHWATHKTTFRSSQRGHLRTCCYECLIDNLTKPQDLSLPHFIFFVSFAAYENYSQFVQLYVFSFVSVL